MELRYIHRTMGCTTTLSLLLCIAKSLAEVKFGSWVPTHLLTRMLTNFNQFGGLGKFNLVVMKANHQPTYQFYAYSTNYVIN